MRLGTHHPPTKRPQRLAPGAPATPAADENRDLGFGSVVASESRQRLLNRDGTFNVMRTGLSLLTSLSVYQALLRMSWRKFLSVIALVYVIINLTFAIIYISCGPDALEGPDGSVYGNTFLRAFFFSVQTFSTIGYGNLVPKGLAANLVVTCESFFGMLFVALATGIIFARFSRPTVKILYSNNAVIAPYRGINAFMFRITNIRKSLIIDLQATVMLAKFENVDGRLLRQFYQLRLERERVTFFPLTWTVVHPIDDQSPLNGVTEEELRNGDAEILIVLNGMDETFSQLVHSRSSYKADEIVWNARFGDIYARDSDSALLTVDIRKLHDIERL
jgi:inward rectifier potassium channel